MFGSPYPLRNLPFCPVTLPWFASGDRASNIDDLRRAALLAGCPAAAPHVVPFALLWPLIAAKRSLAFLRYHGADVHRHHGVPLLRQARHLLGLAVRRNVQPDAYYEFSLWRDSHRTRAHLFVQTFEHFFLLDRLCAGFDTSVIDTKLNFAAFCRNHNLPAAPILAVFERDREITWHAADRTLPPKDLFLKPTDQGCGRGAERWQWNAADLRWCRDHERLTEPELLRTFQQRAATDRMVLQPRLRNHSDLERFSNGSLCTLRVVTARLPGAEPALLLSCLRMPTGESVVDNFAAGGLAAPVLEDGRLGSAACKKLAGRRLDQHPDTSARITGEAMPHWQDLVALAVRAHAGVGDLRFVGWDVALTRDGPLLLEAQTRWSGDLIQVAFDAPLGATRYAEICRAHLARRG